MRRVLAGRIFGLLAFGVSLAIAQPKRPRSPSPSETNAQRAAPADQKAVPGEPKPARAEQKPAPADPKPVPAREDSGKVVQAPQAPAPEGDLGAPPPATAPQAGSAGKLSPLTPAADEFSKGQASAAPGSFDQLLGDIAALRSRVMALTTTLFKSKLRVVVETRGADARIEAFGITLDDGVVFTAKERFSADDERVLYEHAVAPGHHVIGIDIERYDLRNKQFRTWQSSRFSLVVPESRLVEAHIVVEDDSQMAEDFVDDQDGEYDLSVRLRARVTDP